MLYEKQMNTIHNGFGSFPSLSVHFVFHVLVLLYNISFLLGLLGWQVERVSFLNPSSKIDRSEEQSASEDASIETQLDRQPSAVKSNETEANQDDEFGLVNNISQSANIMVLLSLYF